MLKIIIIGGGITGAAIAYELGKYTCQVMLLEKEIELSFGVSKSNSGIIHTGFHSQYDTLKAKLALRGNHLYGELAGTLNFPFKRIGELVVAFPDQEAKLRELYENSQKLGIPDAQLVDREWLDKYEPALSTDITLALLGPSAGVVNPYEVVYALEENATINGVQILCNEEVKAIHYENKGWRLYTQDNVFTADMVINAAGLYADEIAGLAGIKTEKIVPRKGEEFLLDRHAGRLAEHIVFPVPEEKTKGTLIIPTVEDNFMIGPTAIEIEDKEDLTTSAEGKEMVLNLARKMNPDIDESWIIAAFAGLRPALLSGDFYIRQDRPGFINVLGIQSPGLTAAPAIAEHVSEMIKSSRTLAVKSDWIRDREPIHRFREYDIEKQNQLIAEDPDYGVLVCRCETISKGEIKEAIRRGARTLDGIKFRTRCQMGRCHGAFCTMKIMQIIKEETGLDYMEMTKRGKGSEIAQGLLYETKRI